MEAYMTHNYCILLAYKTSITQVMPRSGTNLSTSQASLDHGCSGLRVPGWQSPVNEFQGANSLGAYSLDALLEEAKWFSYQMKAL